MARPKHEPDEALTIGQAARRWKVGVQRVWSLVENGELPGAFEIPSSGRYGSTVKIPLAAIRAAEERWAIGAAANGPSNRPQRRERGSSPSFRHFPELAADPPGHGAESPANGPH